jgi:hypothetical protein
MVEDRTNEVRPATKIIPVGNVKLLNCCKQFCVPKSVGHFEKYSRRHVYFKRDGWEVPVDAYEKAKMLYREKKVLAHKKLHQKPKIIQLIGVLRQLFTANQSAKSCIKQATKSNAY